MKRQTDVNMALGILVLAGGVAVSLLLRQRPEINPGPVVFAPGLLLLGFGASPLSAWAAGVACGVFTAALYFEHGAGVDAVLAGLVAQWVSLLFPLPFVEFARSDERGFEEQRAPLTRGRSALRDALEDLRARAQAAERRGRETDALFHAGREISKLLTLADTLEFSREVLQDTLRMAASAEPPAFLLATVDEDHSRFRVGFAEGLEESQVRALEHGFEELGLFTWLKRQEGPSILVPRTAAEPGLKGIPLPPGVRSLLGVPLIIQGQAIGWVVVFDNGECGLPERDFSNLRILCSQIAIGLEKATLYDRLQRLSVTDGLTGLTVHRHFQSRLDEEIKRAERYHEPLSLVMSDIDHFKDFNDTYGHLAGDAVLKAVAGALQAGLGPSEMAVRYGGEEFVLVLPRTTKEAAMARAEALRKAVKELQVETGGQILSVAISLGVASYPEDAMTKIGLIDMADGALYQSKKGGRNRVTAAGKPIAS
jgi:diguanylate cyclase (GGDEF)-like protein